MDLWTTDVTLKTTKDIWKKPSEMPVTLKCDSYWSMALDSYDDLQRYVPRTTASVSAGKRASRLTWDPTGAGLTSQLPVPISPFTSLTLPA